MLNPNAPNNPKSTEEILREMEEMSGDDAPATPPASGGGALKSLLGLFVKVVPSDAEARPSKPGKPSASQTTAATTNGVPAPGPRVGDLVADEPAPKFPPPPPPTSPFAAIVDLANKPLDEIYKRAKLPPSACSIDDLAKLMENPAIANQPLTIKVVAVNLALSAQGITAQEPVTDAMRRDKALDAYQSMLIERVATTEERNTAKIRQIMKEIEDFTRRKQNEMNALKTEIAETKKQSDDFAARRAAEEQRLADLITPFLEDKPNPVTIGNTPDFPSH